MNLPAANISEAAQCQKLSEKQGPHPDVAFTCAGFGLSSVPL